MTIFKLYKKLGYTPLELVEELRGQKPKLKNTSLTYAGRLDPMAEGLVLILSGKDLKEKEKYTNLNKEYEFEVLLGFKTDSGDILGKVLKYGKSEFKKINPEKFLGKSTQLYPIYSSKTVHGKPLWWWAKEGRIKEISIPSREVEIYNLEFLGKKYIPKEKLRKNIINKISLIKGDFRQKEIIKKWETVLQKSPENRFIILKFRVKCSSGTYIRSLSEKIGKEIGVPALAYSIFRTKIGNYKI